MSQNLGSPGLALRLKHREQLATLLSEDDRSREATEQLKRALNVAQESWGLLDLRSIDLMAPLAFHLSSLGRHGEAAGLFEAFHQNPEVAADPGRVFTFISLGSIRRRQDELRRRRRPGLYGMITQPKSV